MHRILALTTVALGMLVASVPTGAQAQSWWDVEHARMNALAGGPTNAYDAYLLRRYGCYSGTPSAFCHGARYYRAYPRHAHRR